MKLDVPDELGLTEAEAQLSLAVGLYTAERISLAKAARLVGLSRIAFQHLLADRGIPIQYDQMICSMTLTRRRSSVNSSMEPCSTYWALGDHSGP